MSYLETASELNKEVKSFMDIYFGGEATAKQLTPEEVKEAAVKLGHIINMAVRCSPRPVQGTCRQRIVATAMKGYCIVRMTQETDPKTGRSFNKIHISSTSRL